MARRYLDRKTKERYKRLARFEEYEKHVTEKGPPIPEFNDALSAKRIIYLKDASGEPQNFSQILSEKINELNNAAEETSKYIKYVNSHLDKQKIKIDELKKFQRTFEKQITDLDSTKSE